MNNKFPPEWTEINVEDAFEIGRGRVINKTEIKLNQGIYPVYSSQSSNYGRFGYLNTYDFDGEYITWTTDGAYAGSVFYRKGKFNCTNVCGTLKDAGTHKIDLCFIAYYLSTVAKNHVSYVGNPKLMNNTFAKIKILLPKLAEQKKIASILTSVDEVIEKTQSQINKLQDLKKGTMNELLTKGIGHTEFKDSKLGKIPNNWDIQKLGDLCEIRGRIGWKGYAVADLRNEGALVIGATQINKNHEIDLSKPKYISDKKYEESPEIMIQPNDIILVKTGNTIGKLALVSNDIGRATINPNTVILRSKSNFHEFIYFVLTWSVYQSKFWDLVAVGAQPSLNQENIKNILLSLPNQDEMKIINKTLKKHINLINNLKIKKDKLQLLKKSLMQDLLTGKVRVSVN